MIFLSKQKFPHCLGLPEGSRMYKKKVFQNVFFLTEQSEEIVERSKNYFFLKPKNTPPPPSLKITISRINSAPNLPPTTYYSWLFLKWRNDFFFRIKNFQTVWGLLKVLGCSKKVFPKSYLSLGHGEKVYILTKEINANKYLK